MIMPHSNPFLGGGNVSLNRPAIKAVIFDLWETLLFERYGANLKRQSLRCENLVIALNRLGLQVSLEQMELALKKTVSSLAELWEANKDVACLDQIRLILRSLFGESFVLKKECVKRLASAYISPIFEIPPYLNPDAPKVLEELKRRGKRIGLLCNTGLTPGVGLRRLLAKERVGKYFDTMFFSEEVGTRKPDASIFLLAIKELRVKPSEAVHVGDNLRVDVWGAKNAGLKAIYLSSKEGRDRLAESDPNSLVSISRRLLGLKKDEIVPDKEVKSVTAVLETIDELEMANPLKNRGLWKE
jgi:putative hydrolase of the HAD superfamily